MSEPFLTINKKVYDADSMATNLDSPEAIVEVSEVGGFCVHAIWTGTPDGTIHIQGSNDGINFVEINSQATGGAAGQHLLNVERQHYKFVKVNYTATSSTGSLTAYVSAKRL